MSRSGSSLSGDISSFEHEYARVTETVATFFFEAPPGPPGRHQGLTPRNPSTVGAKASGSSIGAKCPLWSNTLNIEFGIPW